MPPVPGSGPGPRPGDFQRRLTYGDIRVAAQAVVPAFGAAGAGTFVLLLDQGAKLSYAWVTEIIAHYDGTEQRISWQALPAMRIDGSAFLLDVDDRLARATLMRGAASGATFLVALPMEEVSSTGDIAGGIVPVSSAAALDWALPGQRVIVVGRDGSNGSAVVQSATGTSLVLDALPAGVPARGARVMPLVPVVLDMQQGFTRHPVNVQVWDIRAQATAFGWCGQDSMGRDVDVLTADAGLVASSDLTDDNLIVWDRINGIDGTASDTMASRAEVVDLGGVPFALGGNLVSEWLRPIKLRSSRRVDFQWLKAVTRHLRGAQGVFILPTHRSDFAFVSAPAFGQLLVSGDYASWFTSLAHRNLAIIATSGPVQYVGVIDVVDNNDGTNTLTLTDNPFGPIAHISFAETVRLETDNVEPSWDGPVMTVDLVAHVVQDTLATGDLLTSAWAGHGLDGNFTFPVGITTMTRDMYWETGQFQSGSILDTAGFVPHFRTACVGPATGTAIIRRNGQNATGSTGGIGFVFGSGTLPGGSGDGSIGSNGAGLPSDPQASGSWPSHGAPGLGGAGGSGTAAGGVAGTLPDDIEPDSAGSLDVFGAIRMSLIGSFIVPLAGGAGGSSGGGSGTQPGGGGGAGGGNLVVCAGQFVNPNNIIVEARGGAGGNGAGTNCGGGGGGGGGLVAIVVGRLPSIPLANINNSGGAGGVGGGGTGVSGAAGLSGAAPLLFVG